MREVMKIVKRKLIWLKWNGAPSSLQTVFTWLKHFFGRALSSNIYLLGHSDDVTHLFVEGRFAKLRNSLVHYDVLVESEMDATAPTKALWLRALERMSINWLHEFTKYSIIFDVKALSKRCFMRKSRYSRKARFLLQMGTSISNSSTSRQVETDESFMK